MLSGNIVIIKTEKEWEEDGFKVFNFEKEKGFKENEEIKYANYQVCHKSKLKTCNKCGKDYSTDHNYLYDLFNKLKTHISTKFDDSTCSVCLQKEFQIDIEDFNI